mmetsp:Transcript_11141/g.25538  ORF Transcript_11141/g.25538 Transcript_11141/m.25538 type:complete len:188 (-) Transcript_11141:41-604(-)
MGQRCCCETPDEHMVTVGQQSIVTDDHQAGKLVPQHDKDEGAEAYSEAGYLPAPPPLGGTVPPAPVTSSHTSTSSKPLAKVEKETVANQPSTQSYTVTLEPKGSRLGFTLGQKVDSDCLEVIDIAEGGCLASWNSSNPGKEVVRGTQILALNGIVIQGRRQDAEIRREIAEACKRPQLVLMVRQNKL